MAVVKPVRPDIVSGRGLTGSLSGSTGVVLRRGEDLAEFVRAAERKSELEKLKAKYKIEVRYSKHRSSLPHVPSPLMVQAWESGRRFHGGGDQLMYWCGYPDCDRLMSSDNFAYMHVVCPHCKREVFLDPASKKFHIDALRKEKRDARAIMAIPMVAGEKLYRMSPPNLATLLVRLWRELEQNADIYLKYSPLEIRYDGKNETVADLNRLDQVRIQRKPVIYTLAAISKDIAAGADLRARFLAMITS